jgi:uncharacterized membrane protein
MGAECVSETNATVEESSKIPTDDNLIGLNFYDTRIIKLKAEKKADKNLSFYLRIFFALVGISGLAGIFEIIKMNIFLGWTLLIIGVLILIASSSDKKQGMFESEIQSLEIQKQRLEGATSSDKTNRYFDSLVSINLKNLEEYYDLVKTSNKKSFWASLAVSIFGVLLIFSGLITSYFSNNFKDSTYVVTASGVIVESISGLLFYLYSRTVLQLKEYHDSLLHVQNVLLSFKLIKDSKAIEDNTEIMKKMIEYLLKGKPE